MTKATKTNEAVNTNNESTTPAEQTFDLVTLAKTHTTKSAMIRYLNDQGVKRGRIAQMLSTHYGKTVRYQHVRNVLVQNLKKDN